MKNNNKLIVALIIASTATTLLPTSNSYATEKIEQTETNLVESKQQVDTNIDKSLEKKSDKENPQNDNDIEFPTESAKDYEFNDEINESSLREDDGTDISNRAQSTDRKTFGQDKNIINIDPEVKKNLKETNGE